MMKRFLFLLSTCLAVFYSVAARTVSHRVVEDGKEWHYMGSNPDVNPQYYMEWDEIYSLEGDTVIGSYKCLKLYYSNNGPYNFCNRSCIGALFEEGEKVYYITMGSATPALLYDFSCEPGTTVQVNSHKFFINERKLFKYRDGYLTVIDWSPIEDGKVYDQYYYWIEGIGSEIALLNETPVWWDGGIWKELLTCKLNSQIIYDKDEFQTSAQYIREDEVTFTAGQMATIILPTEPEASRGKYYRLDKVEENEIIFEQELHPAAHVPYIIVPSEDFIIDVNTLDLEGCYRDTAFVNGISFIGSFVSEELDEPEGSCIDIIDATPDCGISSSREAGKRAFLIGALRAYLLVSGEVHDELSIVLRDKTTSVQSIQDSKSKAHSDVYDLSGRKFMDSHKLPRGIYIEGGQKKVKLRQ